MRAWLEETWTPAHPVRLVRVDDPNLPELVGVFWDLRRRPRRRWRCTVCGSQLTATCPHARAARPLLAAALGFGAVVE